MGAFFYGTRITMKGLLGMILVVSGSFSYAMERISHKEADKQCESNPIVKKERNTEKDGLLKVDSKG